MRRILLSAMVLISLVAFWGCGTTKADSIYLWSEPTFSGGSVTKEFDDFSLQYPSDWIVTCSISKEEAADSNNIFFMIYSSDYSSGYPANLNVAYINSELSLRDVNYANVSELTDAIAQESGADVTLDQILHGKIYDTDMAFAYISTICQSYSLHTVQQYVPMGDGFYVFTYTVYDDQTSSDITSIMNSIKFKQQN